MEITNMKDNFHHETLQKAEKLTKLEADKQNLNATIVKLSEQKTQHVLKEKIDEEKYEKILHEQKEGEKIIENLAQELADAQIKKAEKNMELDDKQIDELEMVPWTQSYKVFWESEKVDDSEWHPIKEIPMPNNLTSLESCLLKIDSNYVPRAACKAVIVRNKQEMISDKGVLFTKNWVFS